MFNVRCSLGATQKLSLREDWTGVENGIMAYEGAISSLGMLNMRNPDGSIDRSPPPTQSLWGILADIEAKCEVENLDIVDLLSNLGGNNRGMMKRNAFQTALNSYNEATATFPKP